MSPILGVLPVEYPGTRVCIGYQVESRRKTKWTLCTYEYELSCIQMTIRTRVLAAVQKLNSRPTFKPFLRLFDVGDKGFLAVLFLEAAFRPLRSRDRTRTFMRMNFCVPPCYFNTKLREYPELFDDFRLVVTQNV
eukprot:498966-Rhodomonas_salina.2